MNDRPIHTPGASEGPSSWYLLFGGLRQEAVGGLRSLRGVFSTEEEARSAFRRLRLARRPAPGWGELVVLEPSGRFRALCWFGVPAEAIAAHPAGSAAGQEAPGTATDVPGVSENTTPERRLGRRSASARRVGVRAAASR